MRSHLSQLGLLALAVLIAGLSAGVESQERAAPRTGVLKVALNAEPPSLPARFGGGPTDYQLLEDETTEGHPRLRLLVHPRLPGIDPEGVARVFLETLGADSAPERMMERIWQESAFVTVERSIPRVTVAGKIQHVHVERGRATHRAGRT